MASRPILVTRKNAAALLSISVGMLDKLVRQGVLEPIRLGRKRVYFRRDTIEELTLPPSRRRALDKAETQRITNLIDQAVEILDEQSPMTIRQLFYRLVSIGVLENSRSDYVKVSRIMTFARNDGRVDWDAVVDRSRADYAPSVWEDAADYVQTIRYGYRKDYWHTRAAHVEIWVEKDAVVRSIENLTNQLGVRLRLGKSFQSTTKVHEIAELFSKVSKPTFVYYLGDHDPSGRCAEDELQMRVQSHLIA